MEGGIQSRDCGGGIQSSRLWTGGIQSGDCGGGYTVLKVIKSPYTKSLGKFENIFFQDCLPRGSQTSRLWTGEGIQYRDCGGGYTVSGLWRGVYSLGTVEGGGFQVAENFQFF